MCYTKKLGLFVSFAGVQRCERSTVQLLIIYEQNGGKGFYLYLPNTNIVIYKYTLYLSAATVV